MLEEEIAAREQLPAGPPQHVGPAGGARRRHKAAQHLHDLQLWRKMVLCSPCTALHRRKRVDTSCSCPQSGDRQPVSHEQRRHVDARRHAPQLQNARVNPCGNCAASCRERRAVTSVSARRPRGQTLGWQRGRKAATAAAVESGWKSFWTPSLALRESDRRARTGRLWVPPQVK